MREGLLRRHAPTWDTAAQYASWLRPPLMPGLPDAEPRAGTSSSSSTGFSAMRGVDDVRRETDERRRGERDLLTHYLDHLRTNGVEPPDAAQAWDDYRTALAYGVFMWGVTLLVDPKIIRRLLQRLTDAAAEHDAFGRLGV